MTQQLLTDRIAGILQTECPSSDVRSTLTDANAALDDAKARRAAAEAIAVDPLADSKAVAAADASIAKIDLEQRRLANAIEQLGAHLTARLTIEREGNKLSRYERALAERDEVAEAIRTDYPDAVDTLVRLAQRIAASDAEIDRVNVDRPKGKGYMQRAETVARGHKPGTTHPSIVANMKLPKAVDHFHYAYPTVDADGYRLNG